MPVPSLHKSRLQSSDGKQYFQSWMQHLTGLLSRYVFVIVPVEDEGEYQIYGWGFHVKVNFKRVPNDVKLWFVLWELNDLKHGFRTHTTSVHHCAVWPLLSLYAKKSKNVLVKNWNDWGSTCVEIDDSRNDRNAIFMDSAEMLSKFLNSNWNPFLERLNLSALTVQMS